MTKTPTGKVRLTIHTPAELNRRTKIAAASLGISTSELVSTMIASRLEGVEEWWEKQKKA